MPTTRDSPYLETSADELDAGEGSEIGEPEGTAGAVTPSALDVLDTIGGETPAEASPS